MTHKLLRRPAVGSYLLILAIAFLGPMAEADARPNIVIILCDDLGYGDLGCYGHPVIKTPNLDQLAATGLRLTACYSAAPVCSPSRVGLLTGRSPNRAGVYDWIPAARQSQADARDLVHLRRTEVTLPQLLLQAGYATCMSGKWHCNSRFNSDLQPQPGEAGFEHWFGTQNNAAPSHENPRNYVRNGQEVGPLEGFSCQLAASEAIDWLRKHVEQKPDEPFFIYLAFHEPHEPVASPPELVEKYLPDAKNEDEAQYFANVTNLDLAVGRVVSALEEVKQRENTLIIFSSDNGPETLNRYRTANRSYGRATPLRGMKLWTTDGGFRVAGIINWPARIQQPRVSDQVVSALDWLPSLCELADAPLPIELELDGTSFIPLLDGNSIVRDKPLVWCYFNALNEHRAAMRTREWKMLAKLNHGDFPKLQNVHDGNRQAVLDAQLTDFELYPIRQDIGESRNVIDIEPSAEQLKARFREAVRELVEDSHYWQRVSDRR